MLIKHSSGVIGKVDNLVNGLVYWTSLKGVKMLPDFAGCFTIVQK